MRSILKILGLPLVTVGEGTRLGALNGVAIDTAGGRLRYLHFDGARTRADGVIPWEAVRSIGEDAITVDSVGSVLEAIPAVDLGQVTLLIGDRPVVTEGGERVGTVTGYDIDVSTGVIERYHVTTGGFFGRLIHSEVSFPPAAVRTIGADAIIVTNEAASSAKSQAE